MSVFLMRLRKADCWLAGMTIFCLGATAAEIFWPHSIEAAKQDSAEAAPAPAELEAAPWHPDALAAYLAIADRPLFTPDRLPYQLQGEEPAPPPQVQAGPPLEFELSAIVTASAASIALLKTNTSPEVRKVGLDDEIEGWTLVEVRADSVVLRQGVETRTIELHASREDTRGTATLAHGP